MDGRVITLFAHQRALDALPLSPVETMGRGYVEVSCDQVTTADCVFSVQVGRRGHCSVEDARAALDLYKLVEGEWEQQLHAALTDEEAPPSFAASNHYMQDEYWPCDVIAESQ